jgi:MFS family permease
MKFLTRTIWLLSIISLFTDVASEMLYPVMPMYLTSIGFSVVWIGVLEGFAEATAGFSKGYFGKLSDALGTRKPFVQIGYSLSAVSKPLMAFLTAPIGILFLRMADRLGKGIRTGARDGMLSSETTPQFKGRVFGFHRAFDTIGAALGPIAALIFQIFYPGQYRTLFLFAVVPGAFAVTAAWFIQEKKVSIPRTKASAPKLFSFVSYWRTAPHEYRLVVAGLLAFAVFNSSDVFLLLMLRLHGASDQTVIGIYIFYNLVYAVASYPLGALGDKIGLRQTMVIGLFVFAVVYAGIAVAVSPIGMVILFLLYGVYAAATEGISKAWISNIATTANVATAIGFYTGMQSICTLVASTVTGIVWQEWSPTAAFIFSSLGTFSIAVYFIVVFRTKSHTPPSV